jgi:hypothetical protein
LAKEDIRVNKPLQLKMKVEKGYQCRFYSSKSGKDWNEIKAGSDYYNADFCHPGTAAHDQV